MSDDLIEYAVSVDDLSVEVAEHLRRHQSACRTFLVAIDGLGGSGKSTLARTLSARLGGCLVVHVDDFYKTSIDRRVRDTGATVGSDFALDRLKDQVLTPLKAGLTAKFHPYNWGEDRLDKPRTIESGGTVIIEGIYSLSSQLFQVYHCRIWIDCDRATRLARGLTRDGPLAREQWVEKWMPAEDSYISLENPEDRADVKLDTSGPPENGRGSMVIRRLK
jgi:uridine kinase